LLLGLLPAAAAGGSPRARADVPTVADAHAEVLRSEQRLTDAIATRDAAQTELDSLTAANVQLVAEIAAARAELRERAIGAFVSATPDETVAVLLGSDDFYSASAKANLVAHTARRSNEALAHYNALKREADPRLVDLATHLQQLQQDVNDANDAVAAARANEAEAERQQAQRELEEAQARERARAAAAAAAAARAAAATTTIVTPVAVVADALSGPTPTAPAPTPPPTTPPPPAPTAPLPNVPLGGPSEAQWAALRNCESGGNYRAVSASGSYRGAYQFDYRTWAGLGGSGDPAAAPPAEQDARAKLLYSQRSWRPWPVCGRFLR